MTAQHREALSGLVYSVCTRPGLTVLVGEAGTGKTTLLYALLDLLQKRRFITAMCTNPTLTRAEFYDLLVAKFGIEITSSLKSRQLLALQETLLRNRADGRPSLLIVDEAQRLSPELLEEIRLLLNMETPREKLLEIIVAGQPELIDVLRRPEMRQLKQRVSCLCKLRPLNLAELKAYLHHRLKHAGHQPGELFSEAAIESIYDYTQGIPRLVNSLCDGALRTGFALQSERITESIINEAAEDLDLTPALVRQSHEPRSISLDDDYDLVATVARNDEEARTTPKVAPPDYRRQASDPSHTNDLSKKRIPQENENGQQKTLGFLATLLDRWR
jgi:general secretion pathway protein A